MTSVGRSQFLGPVGADAPSIDIREAVDDFTRRVLQRSRWARRGRVVPAALVAADLLGLTVSYLLATVLLGNTGALGSTREVILFTASLPCWVAVARLHGLYRRDAERAGHSTTDDIVGVFHLATIGAWLLLAASRLLSHSGPDVLNLAGFWLLTICLIPLARAAARRICAGTIAYKQNTVIVGAGDVGQLLGRKLLHHPEYGANVVGFVDRSPRIRRGDLPEHLPVFGGLDRLPEVVERLDVERVIIAFANEPIPQLLELARELERLDVQVDLVPWLFELVGPRVTVHAVEGIPLLGLPPARRSPVSRALKRAIDIVGSACGLVVLSPVLLYIAVRVRRDSPGPALFRQTRLAEGMREFTAYKFRTMRVDTDQDEHRDYIRSCMSASAVAGENGLYKLERRDSVTGFGRWLRKTSLDELPQLINVLRGDMSLVGPRPCIPYEVESFQPHHLERFSVPQGITGLWQVTARAHASYLEALELDVAYVRGWSLALDLRLLLRTPAQALRQRSGTA